MKHAINWFEIPVTQIDKAAAFYGAVLGQPLRSETFGAIPHAMFAAEGEAAVTGALVQDPARRPAPGGPVLYLDVVGGVAPALARAREAGARIVQPLTDLGPHGTCALIEDRDGNVVGLHAPRAGA